MSGPSLRLQTGSLYVSSYTAAFAGSGGPFGYSPDTGEFAGIISSAGLAQDPFTGSLTGVMAGDVVTFVTVIENTGDAPAYGLLLRNTLPPSLMMAGFTPANVLDVSLTDGAGTPVGYSGTLFDGTGLTTDATPVAAYNADSGRNILLLTYTLQLPARVAIPDLVLPITTAVVQYRNSPTGTATGSGVSAGTTITTAAPTIAVTGPAQFLAAGATATFTITVTLPEGQVTNLRLDDLLSPTLSFVSANVTRTGGHLSGVSPTLSGSALLLGTVLDQTDGVNDSQDQLVVSVVARATQGGVGRLTATVSAADPGGGARWTSVATSVPDAAPALAMTVTAPTVAQAGQAVTVVLRLRNTGTATAYALQITDRLGPGLTLVAGSIVATGTRAAPIVQVNGVATGVRLGALDPNETLVLTLQATVNADVLAGAALDAGGDAVGITGNGGSTVGASAPGVITAVAPRLTLSPATGTVQVGTVQVGTVHVGDVVALSAVVALPPGPSPDVRVTFALPAGLTYIAGSAGAGATVSGQAVTIPLGASDGLQTLGASLQVRVDGSAAVGVATIGAKVSTGFAATAADTTPLTIANSPPVLSGATPLLALMDTAQVMPFANLALTDADTGQTETAVVRSDPAHGALVGPGVYDPLTGTLTLAGSAAVVTAGLAALSFAPVRRLVPTGEVSDADLALTVSDGTGGVVATTVHLAVTTANSAPILTGAWSGQQTTTTLPVLAFTQLRLTDADVGQGGTLTIRSVTPAVGRLSGPGTVDGTFQETGTLPQLQATVRSIVFTPLTAGKAQFAVTLSDGAGGLVQDSTTTVMVAPSVNTGGVQHFARSPTANYLTNINGTQALLRGETYQGPVPYLQQQFIYDAPTPVVIEAQAPNSFVKTFAGNSAIRVTAGQNVVDPGPGSNFIEGGPGNDTFYLNGSTGQVAWDTIVNFHVGDAVTLFGFSPGVSTYTWTDNDGAAGYTGRTIHAVLSGSGPVTASLTFAGKTAADTAHFAVTTGHVGNLDYLAVYSL